MYELRQNSRARLYSYSVPLPELWGGRDLALQQVQEAGRNLHLPELRLHRAVTKG
ncbi:hypothetical protein ACAM_1561 [Aeropyrum camini SY1 = JCM 12091]|uniref:Uncharacterized protein n=1 Tax=Aeropyrum camini SY1 = JCM 12091 TaxID=1198449 RepID=U3TG66_9CREN|nr:hypothetical protein ACAM_1561 [Aeropyrum camini SY1 = JCM 12091]